MTTTPNKELQSIHDRMPVIINKDDNDMWINADTQDEVNALLQPLPDGILRMYEVSNEVNVTKVNNKQLIHPANSR